MERQALNVFRMQLLGAEVRPVKSGSRTLKDAINEAMRDWVTNVETTHYLLGSVAGAASLSDDGARLPVGHRPGGEGADAGARGAPARLAVACVGGGSNAIGLFHPFLDDASVRLIGVEAGGHGLEIRAARRDPERRASRRAARLVHYLLQDEAGQYRGAQHLGRAGLPRRRAGARLPQGQRAARYESVTDDEALAAFQKLCLSEGIIPALESSHAVAYA